MNLKPETSSKKLLKEFRSFANDINFSGMQIAGYCQDWEMVVDKQGKAQKVTPSCKWITGYAQEEFLRSDNLFDKLLYKPAEDIREQLQLNGGINTVANFLEFRIKTKSGTIKWIEMIRYEVLEKDQGVNGYYIHCRDISERKSKEFEIEKLNSKLKEERNLFLKGKLIVFKLRHASEWPVEYVSENVNRLGFDTGYFKTHCKNFKSILHPLDYFLFKEKLEGNFEGNESVEISPLRIINQANNVLYLKIDVNAVCKGKKPVQYIVYAEDISPQVRLQRDADNSEQMFTTAFNVCPDIHAIVDFQSRKFIDVNPAFSEKLGYSAEDTIGKEVNAVLKLEPSTRKKIESDFIARGKIEDAETTVLSSDNRKVKVLLYAELVKLKDRQLIYVTAVDVTESSENKDMLSKLALFAENSVDAAIMTDHKGMINWVNKSFEETKKYKKHEVTGKFYWELFDRKSLRNEIEIIIDHGKPFKNELLTTTKDGAPYWVLVEIIPGIPADDGNSNILILETEITELKNAEKRLFRHIDMQSALISIASNYINTPVEAIGDTTTKALKDIAGFISADRAYVYYYDYDKKLAVNKYKWNSSKPADNAPVLQEIKIDELNDIVSVHKQGELFYIENIRGYKAGSIKKILSSMGIQSVIALPLMDDDQCIGFLGLDYLNRTSYLSQGERLILNLFVKILNNILKRHEVESNLQSINDRFSTVVQNAPVFISAFDKNGKCLIWNKHNENVFGYSREEANKSDSLLELFFPSPEDQSDVRRDLRKKSLNTFHQINPRTKYGKIINVMHATYVLRDGTSINLGYDITERVNNEKKLIESEERFREIIENAKSIHFRQKYDSLEFDYVSPSVEHVLGYTVDEMKNIKFERGAANKLFHPDSDKENRRTPDELDKLGSGHLIKEMKMVHKDGTVVDMRIDYSVSRNENNEPAYILGVAEDITREKKAKTELEKSEEKYRGLVERMDEVLFRFRLEDGIYDYISQSVHNVFGYDHKSFTSEPFFITRVMHPDFDDFVERKLNELRRGQVDAVYEYKIIDASGKPRWILQSNKGVYNDQGEIIALEGMCKNITGQKVAEQKLKLQLKEIGKYKDKLKKLNAQIIDSEERERKRIASYLHDGIGQLLAIANMELSCLFDEKLSPENKSSLEESAKLMKEAITQTRFLTYELEPPMLYESGLIATLKWRAKQIADMTGMAVKVDATIKHFAINENTRIVLYRSINELLNNAIKHSNAKKLDIKIEQTDNRYLIAVKDDGVGFSYPSLKKENIINGKFGLFSLNERLESINGRLVIQSKPGKGTKATIKITL